MVTYVDESVRVSVPGWVTDIEAFRRWTDDPSFPEHGRIWWLRGEVWVDMSREQIFSHILVKTKFTMVLCQLAEAGLGLYLTDGLLLSNFAADISGNPDGTFVSYATLGSDRVRLIEGKEEGYVELQGAPDMVLEVVSRSLVEKDTETLHVAYWEAGIPEYWLVDARGEGVRFDIYRRGARGYTRTRAQRGWLPSAVFGRSFRLTRGENPLGQPDFRLEVR